MMDNLFVDFAIAMFFGLVGLIIFDVITGWIKSFINSNLNSVKNFSGYLKKLVILLIPIICFGLDFLMNEAFILLEYERFTIGGFNIIGKPAITFFLLIWLIIGELLSILENIAQSGIPMPQWVYKRLTNVRDQLDDPDEKKK